MPSPAERYAAARQRSLRERSELGSFAGDYVFGLDPFQIAACEALESGRGVLVVREDTIIQGEIRRCHQIEVYGYVEGQLAADKLLVHQGGQCYGIVQTDNAEIHGTVQGDVFVKHLISIRSSGSVSERRGLMFPCTLMSPRMTSIW